MKKLFLSAMLLCAVLQVNSATKSSINLQTSASAYSFVVTDYDVVMYLTNLGYTVLAEPIQDANKWYVYTYKNGNNYITTVITDGNRIVEHEDILM